MGTVSVIWVFVLGLVSGAAVAGWVGRRRGQLEGQVEAAGLREQVAARDAQVARLTGDLDRTQSELARSREASQSLLAERASLQTALEKDREASSERVRALESAEARLKQEFENLANRIFEEKGVRSRQDLANLLEPLRQQIGEFRSRVDDVHEKESRDRVSVLEEIRRLRELNQQVSQDAVRLTNALRNESKTQGCWGEVVLERVLESSGLRRGSEYETQVSLRDSQGGARVRYPDVVVHLPEGRDVIIDAKVSLRAYEQFFNAADDAERGAFLKRYLESVRTHLGGLSRKDYAGLDGVRSLDLVLMFMPVEGAFLAALEQDPALFQDAMDQHVVLVGPSSLLLTLRIISNLWQREYQNRNALQIAERATELYEKFVGFADSMDDVGRQLGAAQESYGKARDRLSRGRGNLVRQAEMLIELGVNARKRLPSEWVAGSEVDPEADSRPTPTGDIRQAS